MKVWSNCGGDVLGYDEGVAFFVALAIPAWC